MAKMEMSTVIELADVVGRPKARMTLPGPLRIGDKVRLGFRLHRDNAGRTEELDTTGEWRVTSVGFDAKGPFSRQSLVVESASKTPTWRAVRKAPVWKRVLPPARAPHTVLT